jgi:thymidylate synthase (FAD)
MEVTLIAATTVFDLSAVSEKWAAGLNHQDTCADLLAEISGRACYESFDRPNPATATNRGYLDNILRQQHESVLEHASATFWVQGVSRWLLGELTRHRHLSFSVRSTRYVDEGHSLLAEQPALSLGLRDPVTRAAITAGIEEFHEQGKDHYRALVSLLVSTGMDRKTARGIARAYLSGQLSTDLVVTGNLRAWRYVIAKRNHPAADHEIRQLAATILEKLKVVAPNTFQDF